MSPIPTQVAIPQIKWGKRKARSQIGETITEDGRSVDVEYDVLHGAIVNPKLETRDTFILSVENQFYDEEDGIWKQLLDELSAEPICMIKPFEKGEAEKRAGDIFEDACIAAMLKKQKDATRAQLWDRLTWIISIVMGTFIIIAAMQYFGG